ncbi:MAG TPA: tetratricopeptide repeat protein [Pyrinomonadaceae bacterium]|nr:tetratricopeptide repeat protein [Pyrinomonadaceae bacterium]
MAFEKAKVLKAAEKFLSQGKINAAIKEYRQIIKHDDDDLTAVNMLGDLLARAGQKDEAISCFLRIAEHYREQEFRLKAIAMYKKIEKLKPRDPDIANKLGELYAAQGLVVDARAQFLIVADTYTRAGQTRKSLSVLHRIADLDPQNTSIRLQLAENYFKEGMENEAAKAFGEAGQRLLENGDLEKSHSAYLRALELKPNDKTLLRGLLSVTSALGTAEDAAEVLEKAVAEMPDDTVLASMLADAYVAADDAPGAERATALLLAHDASGYRRYIEVARVYLKLGQEDEAVRVLGEIVERMLAGREESDLLELVNDVLASAPEHVGGLRLLARIHWWQRDSEKLRSVLERLAESAEAAGTVEDERYALTQLVRLAPDEARYAERLQTIGGALDEGSESQPGENLAADVLPTFESFAIITEETTVADNSAAEVASEFEWNSVAEPNSTNISFADLNEAAASEDLVPDPSSVGAFSQNFTLGHSETTEAEGKSADQTDDAASRKDAMIKHELESVDFYIAQGYSDIALDTLEILERQFGHDPEFDLRRAQLAAGKPAAATVELDTTPSPAETETVVVLNDARGGSEELSSQSISKAAPSNSGIDSGLAEIFEEFRVEAEGEHAAAAEDFETHYNMATAYKEMDLLDEAIREFQTAAGLTGPGDNTPRFFQCCNMLGPCFVQKGLPQAAVLWFKKALDVPGRGAEEYKALQYELGSAYEQMGDLTRAVTAFTEVYGVDVGYRDVAARLQSLQERQKKKKKQ